MYIYCNTDSYAFHTQLFRFILARVNEPITLVKEIKNDSNRLIYDLPKCATVENGSVKFKANSAKLENFCPSAKNIENTKCLTQNPSENSQCEQEATPYIRLLRNSCTAIKDRKLYGFGYLVN